MSDAFKRPNAIPWGTKATSVPLQEFAKLLERTRLFGEPVEEWTHRMNTSDDPEAVAFRERWAKTESGRPKLPPETPLDTFADF
jgi:hypothetical protein